MRRAAGERWGPLELRGLLRRAAPLFFAAALGCSGERETPEQEIRRLVVEAARAARDRDAAALVDRISEHYADARGNDEQRIRSLIAFHLLRNQAVYAITRILELDFPAYALGEVPEANRAELVLLVGLAGTPIANLEALREMRANLYRFELTLTREDGAWLVSSAGWRPARLDEFF